MLNYRIPVEKFAVLAGWQYNRFSINHLIIYHNIVELDSQLAICHKTNEHFLAIDKTSHIVNHLHCYRGVCCHRESLLDSILNWVSKRERLSQGVIRITIVGNNELSLHTTWCAESSKVDLKHSLTRDSVRLAFCQFLINGPPLIQYWRCWFFSHLQLERLIGSEFEVYIVVIQLVNEDTTKLLGHVATSRNRPVVAPDSRSWTVKTKFKLHLSLSNCCIGYDKV